jgi:DNA-binding LacI/PurR family transcriptional regulator
MLETKIPRATIRDVAAEANVSTSTVSLYIRKQGGVGEEAGQRIAAAIEKLNYAPRPYRSTAESNFVGLLMERLPLPAFADIFYGGIIHGIESQAKEHGYSVVFSMVEEGDKWPRMVLENQVRGLLFLGGSPTNDALATELIERNIPMVLVDNYVPGLQIDCVVPDNRVGGYLALKHLLDLGHQRIAIIEGPAKYKTLTDRFEGALRAAEEGGVPIPPVYQQQSLSQGKPKKGYLEMAHLLSLPQPPTAVFAVSDKTALGALEAIKDAGLKVPDDISIVGFDNIADSEHTYPPLTTIHVPKYEMGVTAMQRLVAIINNSEEMPVRTCVYTDLVIRGSTARPKNLS